MVEFWKYSSTEAIHQLFGIPGACMNVQELFLYQIFDCLVGNSFHL